MKKIILTLCFFFIFLQIGYAASPSDYYGTGLCKQPGYKCIKTKGSISWEKLYPDEHDRDIVQRLNRTDVHLWGSRTLVVPKNLKNTTIYDISPFPRKIQPQQTKLIIVDQDKLAWGAYDRNGELVKWGPISSGKDWCGDIKGSCRSHTGIFHIFDKQDKRCKSRIFPVGRGGAKMPYCMFFYKGFALHGSHEVVGYRASHGCIRIFTRDAKWLNEKFVETSREENQYKGTKVVIQKLTTPLKKR